jgi:plastocyanin
MLRRAALLSVFLLAVTTSGVSAGDIVHVTVDNNQFMPSLTKIAIGTDVSWDNIDDKTHSTTADLFSLWNQNMAHAESAVIAFQRGGSFAYHCVFHGSMHGTIKVRPFVDPPTGDLSTVFTVRVAWINAQSGFTEDIQKRKKGKTWKTWTSTTGQTVPWTANSAGTWQFRSRYRRTSDGAATGWGYPFNVTVTP